MKNNVYMICLLALVLLIPATSVLAASAADERATEFKLMDMERRILVDKLATQRESFEDKARRLETKVIQLERDLENSTRGYDTRIDDLRSHFEGRLDDAYYNADKLFWMYTAGVTLFLTILSIAGWRTVKGWIEGKVQSLSEDKLEEIVTNELVTKVIEKKGGPLIKEIIEKLEKRWQIQMEKDRKELMDNASKGLHSRFDNELKEKLKNVVQDIEESETEEEYDFDDWYLKGINEYKMKNFANAAEYFKNASNIKVTSAVLGNLATSLEEAEVYAEAEDNYLKALKVNSDDPHVLGNYADFLSSVRKDYKGAEDLYKRAINADPKNAINLGNYAGLLLARDVKGEGFEKLEEAMNLAKDEELILELWFYSYAHKDEAADRSNALMEIKKLVVKGVRSVGFDMTANVERARADDHPSLELLVDLERVISSGKDAKDLEKYDEWKQV